MAPGIRQFSSIKAEINKVELGYNGMRGNYLCRYKVVSLNPTWA